MSEPDWLDDQRIRLTGWKEADGRLVAKCWKCRAHKRVGGKAMTAQGFKAMLGFLGRHRHSSTLSPLELFNRLFEAEPAIVLAMAEKWWLQLLADELLKAAGRTKDE